MNKYFFVFAVFLGFILTITGCSTKELSGEEPPEVYLKIGDEKFETTLGTYCWTSKCVDKVGPIELLKEKKPIVIHPGEKITFIMDFVPKPNQFHLHQISGENQKEVTVTENSFFAPSEKGIYYYSYGVWWMDEKKENVAHGDAFYAFVLEVK